CRHRCQEPIPVGEVPVGRRGAHADPAGGRPQGQRRWSFGANEAQRGIDQPGTHITVMVAASRGHCAELLVRSCGQVIWSGHGLARASRRGPRLAAGMDLVAAEHGVYAVNISMCTLFTSSFTGGSDVALLSPG